MDWITFIAQLERINRELREPGKKGIGDLDARHKQLSQSAADVFAAIRDEAQIDVDHGNGAGDLIRRQVRTIRDYLGGLEKLADTMTGVEGDRQDAYDRTQPRDWYSRGSKHNENHDPATGRFTSGPGGGDGDGTGRSQVRRADVDTAIERDDMASMRRLYAELDAEVAYGHVTPDAAHRRLQDRLEQAMAGRQHKPPPPPPGAHKTYNGR